MPKTPSTKLFHLIKSLSSSEKRYFKVFISSRYAGNNKYAQLFDAIFEQEEFDDDNLQKLIYGVDPLETRKYSVLKNYLYDLIVKSLQSYDENSSVDYKLKNMLLGVRTLFKRSHFDDCDELLKKTKKLALEYDDFNTLVEILNWEKRIAYTKMDIAFLDKQLERITNEERQYLQQLHIISEYRNIFFKILVSVRKDASFREAQLKKMHTLLENPLMENDSKASSFPAKVLYYRILSIYNFSKSDYPAFYKSSRALLDIMESNPQHFKEDVSEYISALNNHVVSCGNLGKYEEVRETLEKMKEVKPINADDELKIHRQYYLGKFRLCINTGEFEEGRIHLIQHLKEVKKFDKAQFIKNNFYLQYFCIYFGTGDYENALDSLNEWLKLSGSVERKDLQSLARVLNLVIHYELDNTMLLDSLLRSTYRFLNKENRLSEFERKVIDFIREAAKPHSKKEMKQMLETLKKDFEHLSRSPSFAIFELFDIISWLESKINGKKFAQVVKERFQEDIKAKAQNT